MTNRSRRVAEPTQPVPSRSPRIRAWPGVILCLAVPVPVMAQIRSYPAWVTWNYGQYVPSEVEAGDVDGDGDVDVIVGATGTLYWLENLDGGGSLGPTRLVDVTQGTPIVVVGDPDADGDVDLVSASYTDGVRWHENLDGLGSFAPGVSIGTGTVGVSDVALVDLNTDGDPDLLCTWFAAAAVAWFENDGSGNFGPARQVTALEPDAEPGVVSSADLDGDGDPDVLLLLRGAGEVVWCENVDGLGNFGGGRRQIDSWSGPCGRGYRDALTAGDLDGDGDLDVLVGNGFVSWYENLDGQGSFGPWRSVGSGDGVLVVDLDCDGDVDVLTSSDATGCGYGPPWNFSILWHENLGGEGEFGAHWILGGWSRFGVAVDASPADLDGDGDPEVLTANTGDDSLRWYENLSCRAGSFPRVLRAPTRAEGSTLESR